MGTKKQKANSALGLKLRLPEGALPALGELMTMGRSSFALGELECAALLCEGVVWRVLKASMGRRPGFGPVHVGYVEAIALHRMLLLVPNTTAARLLLQQLDPWVVRERGLRETQWHERNVRTNGSYAAVIERLHLAETSTEGDVEPENPMEL